MLALQSQQGRKDDLAIKNPALVLAHQDGTGVKFLVDRIFTPLFYYTIFEK